MSMAPLIDMNDWARKKGRPPVYRDRSNALKLVAHRWATQYQGNHEPDPGAA